MTRLLYGIEDYLEETAEIGRHPHWIRHILGSLARTAGEAAALMTRFREGY